MKIKTLLFSLLLALGCGNAMAQATYTDANGDEYVFKKHAWLDIQGGVQHTLGESTFGKLLSPNVQIGVGYQFCPWFGARIAANGWMSKGGLNGIKAGEDRINTTFKWNYVAPGIDAIFNLSNAICGWNPNRVFNFSAFLGAAANIGFNNKEAVDYHNQGYWMKHTWDGTKVLPVGRGGIILGFRTCDAVLITLEGNANVTTDHYNSRCASNADWYFNVLLGLRINLGGTYKKVEKPAPIVYACPACGDVYGNGNCPESEYGKCKYNSECQHAATCKCKMDKPQPKPEPKPVPVVKEEPLKETIFYIIRSSDPSPEAILDKVAAWCKKYPNKNITISGYADKGTGNAKVNLGYSQKRAEKAAQMLVERGVSESRMTVNSYGDTVQPYDENDRNRCVIIVGE